MCRRSSAFEVATSSRLSAWCLSVLLVTLLGTVVGSYGVIFAQDSLPPVSYVCPMPAHADVVEDKPGKCPQCQMVLVPVRIQQVFGCPHHPAVVSDKPGKCPLDKRQLMPVVVNLYWTCPDKPKERLTDPGTCGNGEPRKMVREARAHGDHNPRHGGLLFMASDKWHHLEGAYPSDGLLRLYFYDNFTKPIAPTGFVGRAVTKEVWDAQAKETRELETVPLRPSPDGKTLETRLSGQALPVTVTVKMKFGPQLPEERFDFVFNSYSQEPSGQ